MCATVTRIEECRVADKEPTREFMMRRRVEDAKQKRDFAELRKLRKRERESIARTKREQRENRDRTER